MNVSWESGGFFYYFKARSDRMQPPERRWYHFSYLSPTPRLKYWVKCSGVDSHFSFTSSFAQVLTVFTASLKRGACRKSKPLLCFLQSIETVSATNFCSVTCLEAWKRVGPGANNTISLHSSHPKISLYLFWLVHGRAAPTDCFFRLIFGSCQLAAS